MWCKNNDIFSQEGNYETEYIQKNNSQKNIYYSRGILFENILINTDKEE